MTRYAKVAFKMTRKERTEAKRLGKRIRDLRKSAGLTQSGLGALVDLSQTDVSKIESGRRFPSVFQLAAIYAALGVPDEPVLSLPNSSQRPL